MKNNAFNNVSSELPPSKLHFSLQLRYGYGSAWGISSSVCLLSAVPLGDIVYRRSTLKQGSFKPQEKVIIQYSGQTGGICRKLSGHWRMVHDHVKLLQKTDSYIHRAALSYILYGCAFKFICCYSRTRSITCETQLKHAAKITFYVVFLNKLCIHLHESQDLFQLLQMV
jgi:hypothetical protein